MSEPESDYTLFHRIAEPASARIRLRVVELGLKGRIDFQNAETDAKKGDSATSGHKEWDPATNMEPRILTHFEFTHGEHRTWTPDDQWLGGRNLSRSCG